MPLERIATVSTTCIMVSCSVISYVVAYYATAISYDSKMSITLAPGVKRCPEPNTLA